MNEPISIVTFKWNNSKQGYKLKNPVDYGAEHVNILYASIKRNTTIPFNFLCVTDDPTGINTEINIINLWDKCKQLGGCYNRLYIFSDEIETLFGKRFISIDLDCVIVDNIDSILQKEGEFIINSFYNKGSWEQKYNGGLIMMDSGSRSKVWETFDYIHSPMLMSEMKKQKKLIGSDQAWIQHVLGDHEKRFTPQDDGVYDYKSLKSSNNLLPSNAKIVFFPGKQDPKLLLDNVNWVKENWRK